LEDLETLKELNDELEGTHVETERSLHEEIGITMVRGCGVYRSDRNPKNQRIPTLENLTPRSSL